MKRKDDTTRVFEWATVAAAVVAAGGAIVTGCDSSTLFPVRDGGSDTPAEAGMIQIMSTANSCPAVAITVSPPDADVGSRVLLGASASDPDIGGDAGQTLTYAWTAVSGSFDNRTAQETWYTCAAGGPQAVTVAVSDGKCATTLNATVFCFGLPGSGNGTPGGSGGTPGGGNGGASGGSGRSGSGGVSGTGNSPGSGGVPGGSGTGGQPGSGGSSMMSSCPGDPTTDEGDACNQCTMENCVATTDGCKLEMLGSDAARQKCLDLYCCIRANNCKDGDPKNCWCGTASDLDCRSVKHAANGACVHEFEAAAGTDDPMMIQRVLVDPSYAIGGAENLATCRQQFCSKYSDAINNAPGMFPARCRL